MQYTLAKATDDAGGVRRARRSAGSRSSRRTGWTSTPSAARSNFDQRHLLTAQVQYTTGVGVARRRAADGCTGTLFKGWTFISQLTTGSGLPLTPVYPDAGAGHRRHRHDPRPS